MGACHRAVAAKAVPGRPGCAPWDKCSTSAFAVDLADDYVCWNTVEHAAVFPCIGSV